MDSEDKKTSREQRVAFFKRVAELINRDHVRELETILDDSVVRSIDVENQEWRENAVRSQLNRFQKERDDATSDEDEEERVPCGDDEILLDTPNLRAVGVFLFQKKNPPYRRRMVSPEFSIVY